MDSCSFPAALMYFYPRPLRGGRPGAAVTVLVRCRFLSTPSARRATGDFVEVCGKELFLSTPSARRATCFVLWRLMSKPISIHALCEEGDHFRCVQARGYIPISIHALCEEGDQCVLCSIRLAPDFYPRPLRGGRRRYLTNGGNHTDFYPRPLRGGRRFAYLSLY